MDAKAREFEAPEEDLVPAEGAKKEKKSSKKDKAEKVEKEEKSARPDIDDLKNKFLKKRKRVE